MLVREFFFCSCVHFGMFYVFSCLIDFIFSKAKLKTVLNASRLLFYCFFFGVKLGGWRFQSEWWWLKRIASRENQKKLFTQLESD